MLPSSIFRQRIINHQAKRKVRGAWSENAWPKHNMPIYFNLAQIIEGLWSDVSHCSNPMPYAPCALLYAINWATPDSWNG
jgi:hypothetical protein